MTPNLATAQGVEAGTNIENIAIASYTVDGVIQESIESSPNGNSTGGVGNGTATEFVVDRKIDLLVTGNSNANVTPGDSQSEVTFTLQNQGNAIQEFSLTPNGILGSDNYNVSNCIVEVNGVTGTPIAGQTLPTTGNITLSPDQQASISVSCDIPLESSGSPISAGNVSLVGLTAIADKNQDGTSVVESSTSDTDSGVETIFIDGSGNNDVTRDATHSDTRQFIATSSTAAPVVEMNKTILSVLDPNGDSTAVTGSEVTYKIQINTSGIGTIENLIITDSTPADMSYKLNSIRLNTGTQTDISDANDNTDFGISAADTATVNLGSFAAGSQHEILLTYIIN